MAKFGRIRSLAGYAALLALLGLALLPNGQLPKMAGPCGRELCNCPPETAPSQEEDSCCACKSHHPVPRLTLGTISLSAALPPGLAFQTLIDCALLPTQSTLQVAPAPLSAHIRLGKAFALHEFISEIHTPPPRA